MPTTGLDLFIFGACLFILIMGFLRGLIKELLSLIFLIFLILAFPRLTNLCSGLSTLFPNYVFYLAAMLGASFLAFTIAGIMFKRTFKKSVGTLSDRLGGVMVGLLKVTSVFVLLASLSLTGIPPFTMLEDSQIIVRFRNMTVSIINYDSFQEQFFDLVQKNMSAYAQKSQGPQAEGSIEVREMPPERDIQTMEQLQEELARNPKYQSLMQDKEIQEMIRQRNITALRKDPKFREVIKDPELIELFLTNLDISSIIKDLKEQSAQ